MVVEVSTYYLDAVRVFIVLFLQKVVDSLVVYSCYSGGVKLFIDCKYVVILVAKVVGPGDGGKR